MMAPEISLLSEVTQSQVDVETVSLPLAGLQDSPRMAQPSTASSRSGEAPEKIPAPSTSTVKVKNPFQN
jgi:hypothetical protein